MSANVVVFDDPAFDVERARVAAACARRGMQCRSSDDGDAADEADYAVAFLPPGERRVPKQALRSLSARGDRTPLILLSRERLTQPTMWLEGSLLVLMGDSPSETAIASRLRMLDASATDQERNGFLVREVRRPRFFAATFSNYAAEMPGPRMVERAGEWTALLPLDEIASGGAGQSEGGSEEGCGVLRFATREGVLVFDVPSAWGSVTMASPRRAPHVHRFPRGASGEVRGSLRAASADLLVALSSSADELPRDPGWAPALAAGAGAVLDLVEARAGALGSVQGVVMEVL